MFVAACLCGLASFPVVHADGWDWDDFSNNLATDLAPFLSLFGEQITKQYLSESITVLDYFIFAMAPIGIVTAVVSTIRVCGSPSLRAFVGRAQEGGGNAEAELCSSTSRDVCELYNNGGIARVFGRPKILEFIYEQRLSDEDFQEKAGIYTFPEYIEFQKNLKDPKNKWEQRKHKWPRRHSKQRKDEEDQKRAQDPLPKTTFAPNLSLNVGIQKRHVAIFWIVASGGFILQAGVLAFAVIVTYYLQWEKNGSRPESYACPLVASGTTLLCSGMFYCACLIGQSTDEEIWHRKQNPNTSSTIFWAQPGQVLGDQTFDPFSYSDCKAPLQEYITSWKKKPKDRELQVYTAVGITMSGFVLQFIGLRGIHSAVSMAQLGVMMLMSAARAALRMQRLRPDDNLFYWQVDEVIGHELDWLALRIGEMCIQQAPPQEDRNTQERDIQNAGQRNRSLSPLSSNSSYASSTQGSPGHLWRFCGAPELGNEIRQNVSSSSDGTKLPNDAERFLAYRTRLAQMTESTPGTASNFGIEMVAVRQKAHQLAKALESAIDTIFSTSTKIKDEWARDNATTINWGFTCDIYKNPPTKSDHATSQPRKEQTLYLELSRETTSHPWVLKNRQKLEGLLGLWVWSLKSDTLTKRPNTQNASLKPPAAEIPAQRIVATDQSIRDLRVWLGGKSIAQEKTLCLKEAPCSKPGSVWKTDGSTWAALRYDRAKNTPPGSLTRFFGWYATQLPQGREPCKVWSASTSSSLLSLCAQEVFASFVKSILNVVDDVGRLNIQKELRPFRLENSVVTELVQSFIESQLGPREDALFCVLPPMISRMPLSSAEDALGAAIDSANWHRKRNGWKQAETLLKWVWDIFVQDQPSGALTSTDAKIGRAAIALGETYRWALQGNDTTRTFGLEGIRWLKQEGCNRSFSEPINEIIHRYDKIREVVELGKDVSDTLFSAIGEGLTATLTYLTKSTSIAKDMNAEDKGKALCSAAKHGWVEVVLTLLEVGTEVDFKNTGDARTALSYAAESQSIDTVTELMKAGAFPNSADKRHRTPLSYASEVGHISIVDTLLRDSRVGPDVQDRQGHTPLFWAAKNGYTLVAELLLKTDKVKLNTRDMDGQTPLSLAAKNGNTKVVKILLETGKVKADIRTDHGKPPLSWAAGNGHHAVVKLLLEIGKVTADLEDSQGRTPLAWAASKGHDAVVKLLLDTGQVVPGAGDMRAQTPLGWAASNGHEAVVKLLLDTGEVAPNVGDDQGRTPLWWAVRNRHEAVVKLLLETGQVAPNVGDKQGRTPLEWAERNRQETVVNLLRNWMSKEGDATKAS